MATNTLGEFSDGEDDFVFDIDESLWSDPEADDIIRNINEEEILARAYGNAVIRDSNQEEILSGEWSDSEADDIIRNINEEEILAGVYGNDDDDDDVIRNVNEEEILARVYGNNDIIPNIDEDEVQTCAGRNVKTKATTRNRQKARTNKANIIISLKAVKNIIPKNSV